MSWSPLRAPLAEAPIAEGRGRASRVRPTSSLAGLPSPGGRHPLFNSGLEAFPRGSSFSEYCTERIAHFPGLPFFVCLILPIKKKKKRISHVLMTLTRQAERGYPLRGGGLPRRNWYIQVLAEDKDPLGHGETRIPRHGPIS